MEIRYDKEVDAMYIKLSEGRYLESEELEDGVIIDFSDEGKIIGLEILNVRSKIKNLEELKRVFSDAVI